MKAFLKSFVFAGRGIIEAIKSERNMRIHVVVAVYVLFFSFFCRFSYVEYAILSVTFSVVFSAEMFNTAIEKLSDKNTPSYNKAIKVVKDIASGAVLINAIGSIATGYVLFVKNNRIHLLLEKIKSSPLVIAVLLTTFVIAVIFVIFPKDRTIK